MDKNEGVMMVESLKKAGENCIESSGYFQKVFTIWEDYHRPMNTGLFQMSTKNQDFTNLHFCAKSLPKAKSAMLASSDFDWVCGYQDVRHRSAYRTIQDTCLIQKLCNLSGSKDENSGCRKWQQILGASGLASQQIHHIIPKHKTAYHYII